MNKLYTSFALLAGLLVAVTIAAFYSTQPVADVMTSSRFVSTASPVAESAAPGNEEPPQMHDLLGLAEDVLQSMQQNVRDYQAVLVKRERIHGRLKDEVRMTLKVRNHGIVDGDSRGLAVYLKFLEPASMRGREVIWVEGENDDKLIAHEGGFKNFLRVKLEPDSRLAMMGNKYPITDIGLVRLVEKLIEKASSEAALEGCTVQVRENQRVGDRTCRMIQLTQPSRDGFDFHVAQIFVDMERKLPLRYAAFLWPETEGGAPPLEEEYTYLDLETNVGLSDEDFDPDNPEYEYP